MCRCEITKKALRFHSIQFITPCVKKGIIIKIFITQSGLHLEAQPVHIRISEFCKMVCIGGVKPFISLLINVQIIITELIRQIEIAQRRTFYRVIQHSRRYLTPHTPGKSKTGMIPFPLMIGGIHQHSDDFLRIETYT